MTHITLGTVVLVGTDRGACGHIVVPPPPRDYAGRTMPPSHPRPDAVAALVDALTATGDHCVANGDELLDHMVTVGDHATQAALETTVDTAVDVLRELTATCRELSLALSADASPARHTRADATRVRQPR